MWWKALLQLDLISVSGSVLLYSLQFNSSCARLIVVKEGKLSQESQLGCPRPLPSTGYKITTPQVRKILKAYVSKDQKINQPTKTQRKTPVYKHTKN